MSPQDEPSQLPKQLEERRVPFLELLGVRPVAARDGEATFELTIEPQHLRTLGILHGGVTATLLDTAMGYAAVTIAPEEHFVVTVQLNMNFVRPAWEQERLIATGQVLHRGRQTAVARGEIRNAEQMLVATGTATFMFVPRPAGATVPRQDSPPAAS